MMRRPMMRRTKMFLPALAVAAVTVLISAACGGADPTATPAATAASQATATPRPQATATSAGVPTATPIPSGQASPTPRAAGSPPPTAAPTSVGAAATSRPAATPQVTATSAPAAAPDFPQAKQGGQLRYRVESDAPSWDVLKESVGVSYEATLPAYDQLVMMDPNKQGDIVGQVAESWTVSSDNLVWTFKIRRGITFVNGNALTAQDVKFSYEQILSPPSEAYRSPWRPNIASIRSIATPDDYTVVITLAEPDASILAGMAAGNLVMIDREFTQENGRERLGKWPPMGSGPFMGKEGSALRGVSAEVFRRPDYWVRGRPFLNGVKVFIVPDAGTAFAALITGQINFNLSLNPTQAKEARDRLGSRVVLLPLAGDSWWSMAMNVRKPPFNDARVREAVALGIDKLGYIATVDQGLGSIAGFLPPGSGWELPPDQLDKISGYASDRKANIAKAKQLLAAAGFPNGLKVTYLVRSQSMYVDSSVFNKANLEDIGITGDFNLLDTAKYLDAVTGDGSVWTITARAHRTPIADPNGAYQSFHLCGGSNNLTGLCDQKLEQTYKAQNLAAADPAKRRQLVWELENYALRIYHEPVTSYKAVIYASHVSVKNYTFPVFYKTNRQYRDVWIEG